MAKHRGRKMRANKVPPHKGTVILTARNPAWQEFDQMQEVSRSLQAEIRKAMLLPPALLMGKASTGMSLMPAAMTELVALGWTMLTLPAFGYLPASTVTRSRPAARD